MSLSEFDLIKQYFQKPFKDSPDIRCGIGDDAAVVTVPPGMELALSMDTLVAGVHFTGKTAPEDIGYKALAVNLSDLAAMGAEPRWATMSLTMPDSDPAWLEQFMTGFNTLAQEYSVILIGGDLSRGPLSITIQIHGWLPAGTAITRNGARADGLIYVSGTLGDAGLALKILANQASISGEHKMYVVNRLNRPRPRVDLGLALRHIATSAIDISDGLIADLGHILEASKTWALLNPDKLPLSDAMRCSDMTVENKWETAATSGDDYELCFNIPPDKKTVLENNKKIDCAITCIGKITHEEEIRWVRTDGVVYKPPSSGYRHF